MGNETSAQRAANHMRAQQRLARSPTPPQTPNKPGGEYRGLLRPSFIDKKDHSDGHRVVPDDNRGQIMPASRSSSAKRLEPLSPIADEGLSKEDK
jgi:hypothetical protein